MLLDICTYCFKNQDPSAPYRSIIPKRVDYYIQTVQNTTQSLKINIDSEPLIVDVDGVRAGIVDVIPMILELEEGFSSAVAVEAVQG